MRSVVIAVCLLLVFAGVLAMTIPRSTPAISDSRLHVVLVGASIGQSWHLETWADRVQAKGYTAESVAAWQFDKTDALDEVLMRPERKFHPTRSYLRSLFGPPPRRADIVVLKECSSYFPGNLPGYMRSINAWTEKIKASGARAVLATVVPVTRSRSEQDRGKQESLVEFNRQIRDYARQHDVPVLDLEAALRDSSRDAYLRDEFTSGDGSHLNTAAYAVLDQTLVKFLNTQLNTLRTTLPRTPVSRVFIPE